MARLEKRRLRVVSLLPAATEMAVAIGAAGDLVAISHECDFPPEVQHLPRVTASPIDPSASGLEIDAAVRRCVQSGAPVIGVDSAALRAAAPDVILTQSQCAVCAVDRREARELTAVLERTPRLVSLSAVDLAGVYRDIEEVGAVLGRRKQAANVVARMRERISRLARLAAGRLPASAPRVVCIEWIEPVYLAGHWVPELVAAAGGRDVGSEPGARSRHVDWGMVEALQPELLLIMLCGFDVERSDRELQEVTDPVARRLLEATPTAVIDGNAYTSRPGPRLADGAERIHEALEGLFALA